MRGGGSLRFWGWFLSNLSGLVSAAATVVLAIITRHYVLITKGILETSTRPKLMIDALFVVGDYHRLRMKIANVGVSPAINLRISGNLKCFPDEWIDIRALCNSAIIAGESLFVQFEPTDNIGILAYDEDEAGHRIVPAVIDHPDAEEIAEGLLDIDASITIRYEALDGRSYETSFQNSDSIVMRHGD